MIATSPFVFLIGIAMMRYQIAYEHFLYADAVLFVSVIFIQWFINWISTPKIVYSKELSRKEEEVIIMSTD